MRNFILKRYKMKKLYLILTCILGSQLFSQIGINTDKPTKTLDINGDIRVRTLTKKSTDSDYSKVLVTNNSGEIEYWDKVAIQNEMKGNEVENKIMYFSISPNGNTIVPCGRYQLRFSASTEPQIKLVTSTSTDQIIYFSRIRKLNHNSSSFGETGSKRSVRTNETINIGSANDWVSIGSVSGLTSGNGNLYAVNYLDEYYMSYPGDNNLYRITFLARTMTTSPATNSYSMLCEKF